jgi:ectoine hydroxylase-related dioxygenase (phytanoyl-CoA dioxygenase family)|tara:strand:- start:462 stop:1184 length:723 start_codon:yes stop_codon:yes gene_type:complete
MATVQPLSANAINNAIGEARDTGYTIIPDFVDDDTLAELRQLCDELYMPPELRDTPDPDTGYAGKNLQKFTRGFDDIWTSPDLIKIINGIMNNEPPWSVRILDIGIKRIRPGQKGGAMHRDGQIYPMRVSGQPIVANSLLALDPFTADVGATAIVPGSRLWDTPVDPSHETIPVEMVPGSIVIFGGELWHCNGPNITEDHTRTALNMAYCSSWVQPIHGTFSDISPEVMATLPKTVRNLL